MSKPFKPGFFILNESAGHVPIQALGFCWIDKRTDKLREFIVNVQGDPGLAAEALLNMAHALRQVGKEQVKQ